MEVSDQNGRLAELEALVEERPSGEESVELATLLANDEEQRSRGRELCFRGLRDNPKQHRLRLALARLFYLDGYQEFAVRELVQIKQYVSAPSLDRLIESFGELAAPFLRGLAQGEFGVEVREEEADLEEQVVVADIDLDLEDDFDDAFDDLDDD